MARTRPCSRDTLRRGKWGQTVLRSRRDYGMRLAGRNEVLLVHTMLSKSHQTSVLALDTCLHAHSQDDVDRVEHEHILAWRAWVDLRHRVPKASARLFCCPWAGGNSLMFERWSEELPGVEVVPLLLPGRLT